jgi:hypothetical protein
MHACPVHAPVHAAHPVLLRMSVQANCPVQGRTSVHTHFLGDDRTVLSVHAIYPLFCPCSSSPTILSLHATHPYSSLHATHPVYASCQTVLPCVSVHAIRPVSSCYLSCLCKLSIHPATNLGVDIKTNFQDCRMESAVWINRDFLDEGLDPFSIILASRRTERHSGNGLDYNPSPASPAREGLLQTGAGKE